MSETSPQAATGPAPRLHASTLHVDELVDRAVRGRIRVPNFQRGLKWTEQNVQELFDSLWRGFPIGTLLMWQRPAEAADAVFGPLTLAAPAAEDAWWVVDGQQRLTSLVAGLKHPDSTPGSDDFSVYFALDRAGTDPSASPFFRPHRQRHVGPLDLPMASVLDAGALQQWIYDAVQRTGRRDVISLASEVATRIRNYRVPVSVVETGDPEVAREIFLRTNRSGRRMEMHEVFAALAPANTPADLEPEAIARRLRTSFGEIEANTVVKAAHALQGDAVTQGAGGRGGPDRADWMPRTEQALRRSLGFVVESGVPHLRLIPARLTPVVALARFFDRFPSPSDRSLRLLRRWLWRGFALEGFASDARTFRRAIVAVGSDESRSVQALLEQVPVPEAPTFALPSRFDARHGPSRLAMLVLALARPWSCAPGEEPGPASPHTVFDWVQRGQDAAFTRWSGEPAFAGPEARFLTPGVGSRALRAAISAWAREDRAHPALASHLVPPEAVDALMDGDLVAFFGLRKALLLRRIREVYEAFGEPRHSDRPPLVLEPPA